MKLNESWIDLEAVSTGTWLLVMLLEISVPPLLVAFHSHGLEVIKFIRNLKKLVPLPDSHHCSHLLLTQSVALVKVVNDS